MTYRFKVIKNNIFQECYSTVQDLKYANLLACSTELDQKSHKECIHNTMFKTFIPKKIKNARSTKQYKGIR